MSAADTLHPVLQHHLVNSLGWQGLRPLQESAIEPLLAGEDAVLLAPTAGGKTEAALLPLLSRIAAEGWAAPSLLYVCPLQALLNNLLPRVERYSSWLGLRAALWHGDIAPSVRKRILRDPPEILLTTPESLEAILVSVNVDHHRLFAGLRAIVVDEVHAFVGDDRGWHLLAVLERLSRIAGQPLQRVGLSATIGNPDELLHWLQGSGAGIRSAQVVAPDLASVQPSGEVELDYVGGIDNAAKVIATLHRGEKRLVFCDSRQLVEELGANLRSRGVTVFLSHASLSADERRRAEEAFADARDCVIVATSTLELGIDVGDLDRVIQLNAPNTVASFLQRIGRTGRRAGTQRNCLFLALTGPALLRGAGLLLMWNRGWVEPVIAPPEPRHIVAQQLLALCLQENKVTERLWPEWWNGLEPFDRGSGAIMSHLLAEGFLERDGDLLFIGAEAERRFGRRHFMAMTAVFAAAPEFTVLTGRTEIGRIDASLLASKADGPRVLLLAGRNWRVTYTDWARRRCFVEPSDSGGRARWASFSNAGGASFELTRAMRDVLLGTDPAVKLTRRALNQFVELRTESEHLVAPDATLVVRTDTDVRWWTWAGYRANATLAATMPDLVQPRQRLNDGYLRLQKEVTIDAWRTRASTRADRMSLPEIDEHALNGLKFSDALPKHLAAATLAARLADTSSAAAVLAEQAHFIHLM